jgi:hypothetical protein
VSIACQRSNLQVQQDLLSHDESASRQAMCDPIMQNDKFENQNGGHKRGIGKFSLE